MKKLLPFIFLSIISCSSTNQVYICGDHPCKNKKEIDDYFKNNISIEIYVVESEKQKKENQDLVDINLLKDRKNQIKEEENNLSFLKKRKEKEDVKLSRLSQKPMKLNIKTDNKNSKETMKKEPMIEKNINKVYSPKKNNITKIVHLCKKTNECDIETISKKIDELGKNKSFPNINF